MEFLSGNEAIAQGAWEAGARIGVAYPGTPSTETMECFASKDDVYAEWCPNEKVAVEVGVGASAAGARVLATMKHVGVNVAADPLFTAAYTGVNGGLVVMAADDPGMHSSQNEQDSHYYALAARIPMLDPSDSAEAHAFARDAFSLSERFDIPFFIRSTVRVSHAKSAVNVSERTAVPLKPYEKDPAKWVMMPAYAKPRRLSLDERVAQVTEWAETCPYNVAEIRDTSVGIICSGAVYEHVCDGYPDASTFKLGLSWPLPPKALHEFAGRVDKIYVVEEASNYLKEQVRALGIECACFETPLPCFGELSPRLIAESFGLPVSSYNTDKIALPPRPPALCPGCPHRLVFKELMRAKAIVTGDIGCYTLGALPPLAALDTTVDMGASVSMAHGFELALAGTDHRPVVGVIGDSTFGHSGLSSLLNTAYNKGSGTIAILDNRTTAMTGHQGNPFNGRTLQNRPSREMNLEALVRALGIEDVCVVDPNEAKNVRAAIKQAVSNDDLSVIIFRSPCVLLRDSFKPKPPFTISDSCTSCGVCVTLGCPALGKSEVDGKAFIQADLCVGCGQCSQYCGFGAIECDKKGE